MAKREHRKQWVEVAFKFQQFHLVVRLVLLCLAPKDTGLKKNPRIKQYLNPNKEKISTHLHQINK